MSFTEAFREELERQSLSQREVARLMKVSGTSVNDWARGLSQPTRENATRLEELLDVRPRGRFLKMLGYAAPDDQRLLTLEDHIRADDTISAEDKRALLRFLEAARADAQLRNIQGDAG